MMRRCRLDFAALDSEAAVHDALARQLALPAHYGRNLDALWDCLTRDVVGPVEIRLAPSAAARPEMRAFLGRLSALLREAQTARPDLHFVQE